MVEMPHNLVSILYAVKGFVEIHMNRVEEGVFPDREEALSHAQEVLKRIYIQTDRALFIAKRIGAVMKVSKENEEKALPVLVRDVWHDVLDALRAKYPLSGYEVISHIPDDFPEIQCSRVDLAEMLFILAENALQAMKGGGKLVIRASLGFRPGEVLIAHLTVADTGPGIPEGTLDHLFEPFMTTKDLNEGNGLGLCLVKSLVRKNNGSISVSSFKGCGTSFTIAFPAVKSMESAAGQPAP